MGVIASACPICDVMVAVVEAIDGELIDCHSCGTELEVVVKLIEAPVEEEDWGE